MQVFVYEFFTGGGAGSLTQCQTADSLLAEATAMVRAAAVDFCGLPSVCVVALRDRRLPPLHPPECQVFEVAGKDAERESFVELARKSDWTLLIAPETDGALLDRAQWVERAGGRLLSPGSAVIELAGNKQKTAETLGRAGVPVPRGMMLAHDRSCGMLPFRLPVIVKPVDGCGSQGVRLAWSAAELVSANAAAGYRLEELVPGLAASVSVLCGAAGNFALPACEQRLSDDGCFYYLGGRLPLAPELDQRARHLALRAIAALPTTVGYVGVDLVLGAEADRSGDRVIEINPRLTTSYVGLRQLSRRNLAAAMLAVARGEVPDLLFGEAPIEFMASGEVVSCE